MSRVTFSDLYNDYLDINTSVKDCGKVQNVAIVPRKMVEMIIEKCRQDVIKYNHDSEEAACIKQYAESLLKQFEEEEYDFEITAEDLHDYMYGI